MTEIFVCCTPEDDPLATAIARRLSEVGYTVHHHLERAETAAYRAWTLSTLERADIVVVLWTQSSLASPWVIDEADVGNRRGRLLSVEVSGWRPPIGHGGSARVALDPRGAELSRASSERLVDAVCGFAEAAGLQPARRLWRRVSHLVQICIELAPTFAIGSGWTLWMFWEALRDGTLTETLVVRVASLPLVISACALAAARGADALLQIIGVRFRAYRARLAIMWLAEALGAATGIAFTGIALWMFTLAALRGGEPSFDVSTWLVFASGAFLFLSVKYLPLLSSRRLQRRLIG
ncbi:membrane hypothetical protein [uncultured Defluviicoccus sp.]|uniref:TIR domain-containing protein n=1 Tax=metagenome TaxID=256318 RepID=A0A380TIY8_9ZZZZ|nr:membrane hypothetical protein [uncultured Defluviicoccus sp.]